MDWLIIIGYFVTYVLFGSFVFGCSKKITDDEVSQLFCGLFWIIVAPIYILFVMLGGWMSNAGFIFTERRLLRAQKELAYQKKITQDLQETEAEVERAMTDL